MIAHYFTLKALTQEWQGRFDNAVLGDIYSQSKGELVLAIGTPDGDYSLRVQTNTGRTGVFMTEGYNRAKRNVLTRFEPAIGRSITQITMADRDRFLLLHLDNHLQIQMRLFGPQANVFLLDTAKHVMDAFKAAHKWIGQPPPVMRPAEEVLSFETFTTRWEAASGSKTWIQQLRRAIPFLDELLATEALHRLKGTWTHAPSVNALFEATHSLLAELTQPKPCLYWEDERLVTFSLIPLAHLSHLREESFLTTDAAVRVYWRRFLGQNTFQRLHDPLQKALLNAAEQTRFRSQQMAHELAQPSRADRYEKWAHLLIAQGVPIPNGQTEVHLPDLFEPGSSEVIPLDPKKNGMGNAEYYYDKARKTRQSHHYAEDRWLETEALSETISGLIQALAQLKTAQSVEHFQTQHAEVLTKLIGHQHLGQELQPFRRFQIAGYEVWVGRNARENDLLTFKSAQKHDYWLHARGVPGSHVVLRRSSKTQAPPKSVMEKTAAIAAYFSQAKNSSLVPVICTERKFVRKAKKGTPGAVIVEREQVLLVVPALPEHTI